jgi:ABC-type multidrug transport system fused ATPase/permease subunit
MSEFRKKENINRDPEKSKQADALLRRILKKECYLLAIAIPLSLLASVQEFTTPYFIGKSLDAMEKHDDALLNQTIVEWISVLLIGAAFSAMRDYLFGIASENVGRYIRYEFFSSTLKKDVAFFDERKVGDLLSRLQSDTLIVQNGITTNVAYFLKCLMNIIGIFIILFVVSWRNALVTLISMLPISIIMPIYNRLIRFTMQKYQKAKAEGSASASEVLANMRTVKSFSNEPFVFKIYADFIDESFEIGKAQAYYYATMMTFT